MVKNPTQFEIVITFFSYKNGRISFVLKQKYFEW